MAEEAMSLGGMPPDVEKKIDTVTPNAVPSERNSFSAKGFIDRVAKRLPGLFPNSAEPTSSLPATNTPTSTERIDVVPQLGVTERIISDAETGDIRKAYFNAVGVEVTADKARELRGASIDADEAAQDADGRNNARLITDREQARARAIREDLREQRIVSSDAPPLVSADGPSVALIDTSAPLSLDQQRENVRRIVAERAVAEASGNSAPIPMDGASALAELKELGVTFDLRTTKDNILEQLKEYKANASPEVASQYVQNALDKWQATTALTELEETIGVKVHGDSDSEQIMEIIDLVNESNPHAGEDREEALRLVNLAIAEKKLQEDSEAGRKVAEEEARRAAQSSVSRMVEGVVRYGKNVADAVKQNSPLVAQVGIGSVYAQAVTSGVIPSHMIQNFNLGMVGFTELVKSLQSETTLGAIPAVSAVKRGVDFLAEKLGKSEKTPSAVRRVAEAGQAAMESVADFSPTANERVNRALEGLQTACISLAYGSIEGRAARGVEAMAHDAAAALPAVEAFGSSVAHTVENGIGHLIENTAPTAHAAELPQVDSPTHVVDAGVSQNTHTPLAEQESHTVGHVNHNEGNENGGTKVLAQVVAGVESQALEQGGDNPPVPAEDPHRREVFTEMVKQLRSVSGESLLEAFGQIKIDEAKMDIDVTGAALSALQGAYPNEFSDLTEPLTAEQANANIDALLKVSVVMGDQPAETVVHYISHGVPADLIQQAEAYEAARVPAPATPEPAAAPTATPSAEAAAAPTSTSSHVEAPVHDAADRGAVSMESTVDGAPLGNNETEKPGMHDPLAGEAGLTEVDTGKPVALPPGISSATREMVDRGWVTYSTDNGWQLTQKGYTDMNQMVPSGLSFDNFQTRVENIISGTNQGVWTGDTAAYGLPGETVQTGHETPNASVGTQPDAGVPTNDYGPHTTLELPENTSPAAAAWVRDGYATYDADKGWHVTDRGMEGHLGSYYDSNNVKHEIPRDVVEHNLPQFIEDMNAGKKVSFEELATPIPAPAEQGGGPTSPSIEGDSFADLASRIDVKTLATGIATYDDATHKWHVVPEQLAVFNREAGTNLDQKGADLILDMIDKGPSAMTEGDYRQILDRLHEGYQQLNSMQMPGEFQAVVDQAVKYDAATQTWTLTPDAEKALSEMTGLPAADIKTVVGVVSGTLQTLDHATLTDTDYKNLWDGVKMVEFAAEQDISGFLPKGVDVAGAIDTVNHIAQTGEVKPEDVQRFADLAGVPVEDKDKLATNMQTLIGALDKEHPDYEKAFNAILSGIESAGWVQDFNPSQMVENFTIKNADGTWHLNAETVGFMQELTGVSNIDAMTSPLLTEVQASFADGNLTVAEYDRLSHSMQTLLDQVSASVPSEQKALFDSVLMKDPSTGWQLRPEALQTLESVVPGISQLNTMSDKDLLHSINQISQAFADDKLTPDERKVLWTNLTGQPAVSSSSASVSGAASTTTPVTSGMNEAYQHDAADRVDSRMENAVAGSPAEQSGGPVSPIAPGESLADWASRVDVKTVMTGVIDYNGTEWHVKPEMLAEFNRETGMNLDVKGADLMLKALDLGPGALSDAEARAILDRWHEGYLELSKMAMPADFQNVVNQAVTYDAATQTWSLTPDAEKALSEVTGLPAADIKTVVGVVSGTLQTLDHATLTDADYKNLWDGVKLIEFAAEQDISGFLPKGVDVGKAIETFNSIAQTGQVDGAQVKQFADMLGVPVADQEKFATQVESIISALDKNDPDYKTAFMSVLTGVEAAGWVKDFDPAHMVETFAVTTDGGKTWHLNQETVSAIQMLTGVADSDKIGSPVLTEMQKALSDGTVTPAELGGLSRSMQTMFDQIAVALPPEQKVLFDKVMVKDPVTGWQLQPEAVKMLEPMVPGITELNNMSDDRLLATINQVAGVFKDGKIDSAEQQTLWEMLTGETTPAATTGAGTPVDGGTVSDAATPTPAAGPSTAPGEPVTTVESTVPGGEQQHTSSGLTPVEGRYHYGEQEDPKGGDFKGVVGENLVINEGQGDMQWHLLENGVKTFEALYPGMKVDQGKLQAELQGILGAIAQPTSEHPFPNEQQLSILYASDTKGDGVRDSEGKPLGWYEKFKTDPKAIENLGKLLSDKGILQPNG